MNENKLKFIMFCGLPASGKSTYINKLLLSYTILSSDAIRQELFGDINNQENNNLVFETLNKRVIYNLEKGNSVIYDATNITMKSRRKILNLIKDIDCYKECIIMATPYEECLCRNEDRDKKVPAHVIERMYKQFQIPFLEEGFDYIKIHYSNDNISNFQNQFNKYELGSFDQKSKHHKYNLLEHSERLFSYLCNEMLNSKYKLEFIERYRVSMLHDISKLKSQTFDENGDAHYYNHENIGTYDCLCNIKDLSLNELFYINYHMLPFDWNTEKANIKWRNIFGDEKYQILLLINEADKFASGNYKE